jgi:hypothetical protein
MWTTRIRNWLFVGVGATALVTIVRLEVAPARAGIVIDDDTAGAAPPPSSSTGDRRRGKPAPPPPPKDPPKLAQAVALATTADVRSAPLESPPPREPTALLTVPDFKGKRLSVAMRDARKLGLKVRGEADGERIFADEASGYRVRRQATAAGTEVPPGTVIDVAVREVVVAGSGY